MALALWAEFPRSPSGSGSGNTIAVGTLAEVFQFLMDEDARPDRSPFDAEDAWWPEAIMAGLMEEPDYIHPNGLAVWWSGDVAVLIAPCDFKASGHRFLTLDESRAAFVAREVSRPRNTKEAD